MQAEQAIKKAYRQFRLGILKKNIKSLVTNDEELSALLNSLIQHREHLRDAEIAHLRQEASLLLSRLEDNRRSALIAEIACFKDVLRLHQMRRRSR